MQSNGIPKEVISKRIQLHAEKAQDNLRREAVYLAILDKRKEDAISAYENRRLIKEGKRVSCKQRKVERNRECRHARRANLTA